MFPAKSRRRGWLTKAGASSRLRSERGSRRRHRFREGPDGMPVGHGLAMRYVLFTDNLADLTVAEAVRGRTEGGLRRPRPDPPPRGARPARGRRARPGRGEEDRRRGRRDDPHDQHRRDRRRQPARRGHLRLGRPLRRPADQARLLGVSAVRHPRRPDRRGARPGRSPRRSSAGSTTSCPASTATRADCWPRGARDVPDPPRASSRTRSAPTSTRCT